MKLTLDIAFEIGQVVYLKTDMRQEPRMIVGYDVRPNKLVYYVLQSGDEDSTAHHDFEISEELNVILNTTN